MKYIHKENLRRLFGDRAVAAAAVLNDICFKLDDEADGALTNFISRSNGLPHQEFVTRPALHVLVDLRKSVPSSCVKLAQDMHPGTPDRGSVLVTMFLTSDEYLGCNLESVLNGRPSDQGLCTVYQHILVMNVDGHRPANGSLSPGSGSYVGMTRRSWQERWGEHLRSARIGSPYLFHNAIREFTQKGGILKHIVVGSGLTFKEAMELEEETVSTCSLRPLGYNMIPGGFAGVRYLGEHGIRVNERNFECRDAAIAEYLRENPAIAKCWLDPEYAARCMCGWGNRLSVEQIRAARQALKSGASIQAVAELVKARNIAQIARLASSKTYRRILQ